jgi:AcrR family transcriptional regulator
MNITHEVFALSMPPLPAALSSGLRAPEARPGKRARTRLQLVDAAIRVFSARGVAAATVQEIAAAAGMTTGTFYNHFGTRDELTRAVAATLMHTLCERISESFAQVTEGAQRMAIGQRRYLWLARESPAWALLLMDVSAAAPELLEGIRSYVLADLRLGVRQKSFRVPSEDAAIDMIQGTSSLAIRRVALGRAPEKYDVAVAAVVLRGLGMPADEAAEVARRPLPPFGTAGRAG